MRRVLIICVLLLSTALLFSSGQQEGSSEAEKASLRFSHWIGPDQWGKVLEAWAEEYEEQNPNVEIAIEMTPWTGYWSKLQTSMAGGTEPDVMEMSGAYFFKFAPGGALLDMNPYLEKQGHSFDDFYSAPLQEVTWEGKMYSIPYGITNGSVLYYNKNIFDGAGLDYPDNTYAVEKWIADGKKITSDTDGDGKNDQYGNFVESNYSFWPLIWDNGGDVLNDDLNKCLLDQPEAVEAFQLMHDMVHKQKISPTYAQIEGIDDFFLTGKLATHIDGDWTMATYDTIEEFEWDFTIWPKWKGNRIPDVYVGGYQHSISANTEFPDQAWGFTYFLTIKHMENAVKYGFGTPALKEIADRVITPDQRTYRLLEQVPDGHGLYFNPNWFEMVDIYENEVARPMLNGKMTPEEAGDLAVKRINALLQ